MAAEFPASSRPDGGRQFIFPNGLILRFDLEPGLDVTYDFNVLEQRAAELAGSGRPQDAIKIYLFMAEGDSSLDGGHLAKMIAQCYERIGDLYSAKYWYGRAIEENPEARRDCVEALNRLERVTIDDLVPSSALASH